MSLGLPVNIYIRFARIHPSRTSLFHDIAKAKAAVNM